MAVNITVVLIKSKIMTTRLNGLTINDMEKAVTITSPESRDVRFDC